MKRTLSLLLLFPFALNASPYPKGMIIRPSLVLQGDAKNIAQVRVEDDGTNWQLKDDNNRHNYSSDLYAITLAVAKVTQERGIFFPNDKKTYPCLHIETVITKKNDPIQKDVRTTPFLFDVLDTPKHIDLDLKDDEGKPIRLILGMQTYTVRDDK